MNLLEQLPVAASGEVFTQLLRRPGVRIERIVSRGQVTPVDAAHDQSHDEWVLVLAGGARLWIEGEDERTLRPGDCVLIPARVRHRVTWTANDVATVWLALHFQP